MFVRRHDGRVPAVTVRVPQEERTRAMRARLMEATVELLVERGFAGTSTTLVSERAGVSRGAQLHHFPTKNDLVVAAVEHLTEVRGAELAAAAERGLPRGARRTRAVLALLADHFTSPVFTAALELWVAARTDASLRAAVVPLEQRVGRQTHRMTVELLGADESRAGHRELVQATLDLVRGLGLADTITDDTRRRKRILDRWAAHPRPGAGAMNDVLDGVLADLAAEGDRLESLVSGLDEAGWRTPDPGRRLGRRHPGRPPGLDRRAPPSPRPPTSRPGTRWCSRRSPTPSTRSTPRRSPAARGRRARCSTAGVPDGCAWPTSLRAYPAGQKMPWYGPPMSATSMATARLMETWAHALDVHEALGVAPEVTDRIRHVAHLGVRTRRFSFAARGEAAPQAEPRVTLDRAVGRRLDLGPGGGRADGDRSGVRLLPARHPARAPRRHRARRDRSGRRPVARHRAVLRRSAR